MRKVSLFFWFYLVLSLAGKLCAGWRCHKELDIKLQTRKGSVIKEQPLKTQSIEKEGIETSLDECKNPWDGHRHLRARTRGENGRERGEGGGGSVRGSVRSCYGGYTMTAHST